MVSITVETAVIDGCKRVSGMYSQDWVNRINKELGKEWLKLADESETGWYYSVRFCDRDGVVCQVKVWVTDLV